MHIMVDLETMGNESSAAIVSIGAVRFNSGTLGEEFYVNVDLQSCLNRGMTVNGGTIMWWLSQSKEAREALNGDNLEVSGALDHLRKFIKTTESFQGIWGNGATFDNVILANAYKACGLETPWPFWSDKCYRTMKAMLPPEAFPLIDGSKAHNALEDAKYQANYLIAACKKAGVNL